MKKLTTAINYLLVQPAELPPAEQALVQKAIDATNNSYARYSNFHVGAACLLENGNVVIGANQENAAFPSGLCAERTAIFAAQANHPDQPITTLASRTYFPLALLMPICTKASPATLPFSAFSIFPICAIRAGSSPGRYLRKQFWAA